MAITASVTRGFTYATGVEISASNLNELGEPTVTVATPIAVGNGGTNATTASAARTNLGLGTIATQAANNVAVTGGAVSGVPSASPAGQLIYVTDGNSGAATVACSDGSNWKVVALGATIST